MDSKFHKKIRRVVTDAQLTPELSRELTLELESYFYEKERDLQFKGVKPAAIEQQMEAEFGEEAPISAAFTQVHRPSFIHSLFLTMIQDKSHPHLFENGLLFMLAALLFHNTAWDINLRTEAGVWDDPNLFNLAGAIVCILLLTLISARMLWQKETAKKVFGALLVAITLAHYAWFAFVLIGDGFLFRQQALSDRELMNNPSAYDEWEEAPWETYQNFREGYMLQLPLSYGGFNEDGLFAGFSRDLNGYEHLVAVGPYDQPNVASIRIQVFDSYNTPEKSTTESWLDYYTRSYLSEKKHTVEEWNLDNVDKAYDLSLAEEWEMRKNVRLMVDNNRLYAFLYDSANPIHENILGTATFTVPADRTVWVTYDNPACPYTLQLPEQWGGQYGLAFHHELIELYDENCGVEWFGEKDQYGIGVEWDEKKTLEEYLSAQFPTDSKDQERMIQERKDLQWNGQPAVQLTLQIFMEDEAGGWTFTGGQQEILVIQTTNQGIVAFTFGGYESQIIRTVINSIEVR